MRSSLKLIIVLVAIAMPAALSASVAKNPLDATGMNGAEAEQYFRKIAGQGLQVQGVVKNSKELKFISNSLLYEIPAYWKDGVSYVKYGVVCQRKGEPTVIFADEGYLSPFVLKNVVDREVTARGKFVNGDKVTGLPHGIVFVIDYLHLDEAGGTGSAN